MKWIGIILGCAAIAVGPFSSATLAASAGGMLSRVTLLLKADGTAIVTNETTQTRMVAEQTVRGWLRFYSRDSEDENDAKDAPDAPPANTPPKPFTDEELAAKLRATTKTMAKAYGMETEPNVERLLVTSNGVYSVTTISFPSLRDVLAHTSITLGQSSVPTDNIRFETTNGQLRITFLPAPNMKRYVTRMRDHWKLIGASNEFRLVLPGRIVSSDFGQQQDNTTWFLLNPQSDESLAIATKFFSSPPVVIAELGGLKLEAPLETKTVQRTMRRPAAKAEEDLPITDAGPGFVSEPVSVTTSTLHIFPGAEEFVGESIRNAYQTGTVVRAKLFAPKGRTLHSLSRVRVLMATDNKGHSLTASEASEDGDAASSADGSMNDVSTYTFGGSGEAKAAMTLDLRLATPAADADSISEITAQVVATTVGKWNDLMLTNPPADAAKEIDLGTILPGAKLIIRKSTNQERQRTLETQLKGPKQIGQLQLDLKRPGERSGHSYASERQSNYKGEQNSRTVNVQSYGFDEESASDTNIVLRVRYPADLKRERVQIKLSSLDLF